MINTEHFPTIGMFAAANLVIGKIHLYEKGELLNCQGLKVDFEQHGLYYESNHGPNWWSYFFEPISIGIITSSPFMSLGRKDAMPFVQKVLYLAKRPLT
ncbi:MAG: hypothetical protein H6620_09700 [Halobacteriovoraceae bacterium]|nr:hypothetical protein [Halobacteriovoraceae bacterium]